MTKTSLNLRKSAILAAPLALLALAGCAATPFRADVSRFQEMPPAQGQSFIVKASNPKNDGGIEFGQYAAILSAEMVKQGYVQASGENADLTVLLDYGVDKGKERVVRDRFYDPYWGYGYSSFHRPYYHHRSARYAFGYYDPFLYGGYGHRGGLGVDSYTVYTGDLDVVIKRNSDGKNLFEGKAEAKSRSNKLPYLVPNLTEAMFTGFPGNNGEMVRISIAPEPKKKKK